MITDPALLDRLLRTALARGGDYADVFAQRRVARSLQYEEGKVKAASEGRSQGVGIRVQQGEATGFAVCEDPDPDRLLEAARQAAAIAAGGGGRLQPLVPATLPRRYEQRQPLAQAALADRIRYAADASQAASAADPRITWVSVSVADSEDEIAIATSDGVFAQDRRPRILVRVNVLGEVEGRRESAGHGAGGRAGIEFLAHHPPAEVAREAVRLLDVKLRALEAKAGAMPVVIKCGEGGIMLHEAVGHGLEADFNRKGTSAYSGRVGEAVASPLVTLFDRADVPGDSGSLNVDDEGIVPGETVLIEQGVLRGYLTDRLSARLMGSGPTGNGRRQDYHHVPQPRMRVTGMRPGQDDPQDIIRSVRHGLYVAGIGGGSVDITKGDFNFTVEESYQIIDGQIGPPVRGACLIGNGPDAMRRIERVGHDLKLMESMGMCGKYGQSVPVGFGCPTLLIGELVVGGRA